MNVGRIMVSDSARRFVAASKTSSCSSSSSSSSSSFKQIPDSSSSVASTAGSATAKQLTITVTLEQQHPSEIRPSKQQKIPRSKAGRSSPVAALPTASRNNTKDVNKAATESGSSSSRSGGDKSKSSGGARSSGVKNHHNKKNPGSSSSAMSNRAASAVVGQFASSTAALGSVHSNDPASLLSRNSTLVIFLQTFILCFVGAKSPTIVGNTVPRQIAILLANVVMLWLIVKWWHFLWWLSAYIDETWTMSPAQKVAMQFSRDISAMVQYEYESSL